MGVIDPITKVGEFLRAQGTPLYQLCGLRVWSPVAQAGYKGEQPAVVFHSTNDDLHETKATEFTHFIFKCYGGTGKYEDARKVCIALTNRVHGANDPAFNFMRARVFNRGQPMDDPDIGRPICLAEANILFEGE